MNRTEFMKKYKLSDVDTRNEYLAKWNAYYRSMRPIVSKQLESTVCQSGKTAQIWIQSDACQYSKVGACTCCDYFQGSKQVNQVQAFKKALERIEADSDTIVLNTCGSVLDESELALRDLLQIINCVKETEVNILVLETHICTINEQVLSCLRNNKGSLDIYFEIGVETLNEDINRFILNKLPFSRNVKKIVELIHEYGFKITANVMTGYPFVDREFQVYDSQKTIQTLLSYGVDFIVLFPINIKKYTLMYAFYEKGLYMPIDGRILIDILYKFQAEELEHINVAWYGEPRIDIPGYSKNDMITPFYCEECYKTMMSLWLTYNNEEGTKRQDLLKQMKSIECGCNNHSKDMAVKKEIDYLKLDRAYQNFCESFEGNKG